MCHLVRTLAAIVVLVWVVTPSLADEPKKTKEGAKVVNKETATKVVFESPEACYKAFVLQQKNDDPAAKLPCMSEAMSSYLLGNLAFNLEKMAHLSDGGEATKECQQVLKKHKLYGKDLMGFLQIVDSPGGGGAPLGFMQIGDSVADKPAFLREATVAMQKVQALFEKAEVKPDAKGASDKKEEKPKAPELRNVKIEKDSAKGELIVSGEAEPQPIVFKKQAGSWVIAVGEKEPDFRKPLGGRFKFSGIKADSDSK